MSVKELAEKFIKAQSEAWKNGKFDELEALEHENVVYHVAGMPDVVGWEGHKQYIQGTNQIVSGLEQQWEYIVGDVNLFSLSYKARFKMKAEHPVLPIPVGKMVNLDFLTVNQLKDGKIAEVWMNGSMNVE